MGEGKIFLRPCKLRGGTVVGVVGWWEGLGAWTQIRDGWGHARGAASLSAFSTAAAGCVQVLSNFGSIYKDAAHSGTFPRNKNGENSQVI